jgi:hypothetical protein
MGILGERAKFGLPFPEVLQPRIIGEEAPILVRLDQKVATFSIQEFNDESAFYSLGFGSRHYGRLAVVLGDGQRPGE